MKNKKILSLIAGLGILSAVPLQTKAETGAKVELKIDQDLDMETGAAAMSSVVRLGTALENFALDKIPYADTKAGRLVELVAIDYFTTDWLTTFQHEYFGHGARVRELGGTATIGISHPWSSERAYTSYSGVDLSNVENRLILTTGGIEANTVLANNLEDNMLVQPYSHQDALLYMINRAYGASYILNTPNPARDRAAFEEELRNGGDIANYLERLDAKFGGDSGVSYDNLVAGAVYQLLDPMLLKGFYDQARFVWSGKNQFTSPRLMLGTTFNLTPIGPEYYINGFLRTKNKKLLETYLRYGFGGKDKFYGLGFGVGNVMINKRLAVNSNIDLWQQESFGGSAKVETNVNLTKNLSLIIGGGYKTKGYLLGEEGKEGVFGHIGIGLGSKYIQKK